MVGNRIRLHRPAAAICAGVEKPSCIQLKKGTLIEVLRFSDLDGMADVLADGNPVAMFAQDIRDRDESARENVDGHRLSDVRNFSQARR